MFYLKIIFDGAMIWSKLRKEFVAVLDDAGVGLFTFAQFRGIDQCRKHHNLSLD
jgi:hypothetical protein